MLQLTACAAEINRRSASGRFADSSVMATTVEQTVCRNRGLTHRLHEEQRPVSSTRKTLLPAAPANYRQKLTSTVVELDLLSGASTGIIKHGEVHKQVPLGTWHELVIQVNGNHVRGHIAGDTTISVEHALDAAPAGRVGVWAKRDAITAFRSFTATP